MASTKQQNKCITLKGSAATIKDYLYHSINSVLQQRGVFPPNAFQKTPYYGIDLYTVKNHEEVQYLDETLNLIEDHLREKTVSQVTLVLTNSETREVLEMWDFKIDYKNESSSSSGHYTGKDPNVIRNEIRAVIRQILGATTILPLLDEKKLCYEIQATPTAGTPMWPGWHYIEEPQNIAYKQDLAFRSFSTSDHAVATSVQYKGI